MWKMPEIIQESCRIVSEWVKQPAVNNKSPL